MLRWINFRAIGKFFLMFLILLITVVFCAPLLELLQGNKAREIEFMQQTVQKALVQCYALEGSYPATIEYLSENYGVQLHKDQYVYYYRPWAANFMPEFKIIPKE